MYLEVPSIIWNLYHKRMFRFLEQCLNFWYMYMGPGNAWTYMSLVNMFPIVTNVQIHGIIKGDSEIGIFSEIIEVALRPNIIRGIHPVCSKSVSEILSNDSRGSSKYLELTMIKLWFQCVKWTHIFIYCVFKQKLIWDECQANSVMVS